MAINVPLLLNYNGKNDSCVRIYYLLVLWDKRKTVLELWLLTKWQKPLLLYARENIMIEQESYCCKLILWLTSTTLNHIDIQLLNSLTASAGTFSVVIVALEANNDTYCLQKRIEKFPLICLSGMNLWIRYVNFKVDNFAIFLIKYYSHKILLIRWMTIWYKNVDSLFFIPNE